jgi:hypothetical protein
MKCSVCYDNFFINKTREEFEKICEDAIMKKNYDEIMKLTNLLITPQHNTTHICSTPNCDCVICQTCWIKITHKGKDIMEANEDDMPTVYDKFICPYCRNVDWKDYKNNVFHELRFKLLTPEEIYSDLFHE